MIISGGHGKHVYRVKFASDAGISIWYYFRADNMVGLNRQLDGMDAFKEWPYIWQTEYVK